MLEASGISVVIDDAVESDVVTISIVTESVFEEVTVGGNVVAELVASEETGTVVIDDAA